MTATPKVFPQTPDQQLAAMRRGQNKDLTLKCGGLDIPCRILSNSEESIATANARAVARRANADGTHDPAAEAAEIMKAVLLKATNVHSIQYVATIFLNALSSAELGAFYDQYVTLMNTVNPEFENVSVDRIGAMIAAVKKKEKVPKDFFTWELAAIGRFFLDEVLQQGNAPGR